MDKAQSSDFEVESRDLHLQSKMRSLRIVDNARVATTALALLMGITVLGLSGNTLAVYDYTHVPSDFLLSLWPDQFNIRPTISLVVGSAILIVTNIAALCFSKVQSVSRHTLHSVPDTRKTSSRSLTDPPAAAKQDHNAHLDDLCCPSYRLNRIADRHHLLLCG